MVVSGYRATKHKIGAHAAVVDYAEAVIGAAGYANQIGGFDRMRRTRNRSEYGLVIVGTEQLKNDLQRAKEIVAAVVAAWPAQ